MTILISNQQSRETVVGTSYAWTWKQTFCCFTSLSPRHEGGVLHNGTDLFFACADYRNCLSVTNTYLRLSFTGLCPATPRFTWLKLVADAMSDNCELHSADTWTFVSQMHSSFEDMTFAAAGLQFWNSLPPCLRRCGLSYGRFRQSLKTFLFGQWGHGAVWTVFNCVE